MPLALRLHSHRRGTSLRAVPVELSIIVPVYNEADNILPLAQEVTTALESQRLSWELVWVDDASTDRSWRVIVDASKSNPRIRGLRHSRNAGQSTALWTGIQATESPLIATLDGDLQNDPADLPGMLAELSRVDFVCGHRTSRNDNWVRRVSSRMARWARKMALKADFADTGCALRVFKREALKGVFPFNGWHRFLPILVHGGGAKTLEIPVRHRPRVAGQSKYGIWNRLGRGLYDLFAMAWYQKRRIQPIPFESTQAD